MDCDAVDEVTRDPTRGVADADLVIVCTPIGQFERVLGEMAGAIKPGALATDVAMKVEVMKLAARLLPRGVAFVGSHPMAGSERSGVEYSRADLFDRATCIITPPPRCPASRVEWVAGFWQALDARTVILPPATHDRLLARISHLPHAVAAALVALGTKDGAMRLAGPGFADTTRIANWRRPALDGRSPVPTARRRRRRSANWSPNSNASVNSWKNDEAGIHKWLQAQKDTRIAGSPSATASRYCHHDPDALRRANAAGGSP